MKKYIFFLGVLFGNVQAQQVKTAGFRIEGHIKGLEEKSRVTLNGCQQTYGHSRPWFC